MTALSQQDRIEVRSADGTLIPVYCSGSGRPLVLVHGAGGDHSAWDAVRPYLEARAKVYAVDRRTRILDSSVRYNLQREFEDTAAVANSTGIEVDIVGQSSGAVCALGASSLVPKLRRLVLYEPPLLSSTPSNLNRLEELLRAGDLDAVAEAFLTGSVKLSTETVAAMKDSPSWTTTVALAPSMVREEAVLRSWRPHSEDFRALKLRVLFLTGEKTPESHHHRGFIGLLTSAGVDISVVEIAGQEHAAHRGAPEVFARLVLDFLEDES